MASSIYDRNADGNMQKRWAGMSGRVAKRVKNNLGIIYKGNVGAGGVKLHRSENLYSLENYYRSKQYDHLPKWDKSRCDDGNYVPIRKRKPRIIVPFAKTLASRVGAKLVGKQNFPEISVETDLETEIFYRQLLKSIDLDGELPEPIRLMMAMGSSFLRFYSAEGTIKFESYSSNYCYPEFKPDGTLNFIRIRYVYFSEGEYDKDGEPLRRWYQLDLGEAQEILYDNPEFDPDATDYPEFSPMETMDHGLGFVQGVWFHSGKGNHKPDGESLYEDIRDYIDELCYSVSQSSAAISYNQDPQVLLSGMDTDTIDELVRSTEKAWNLGREGEAKLMESNLGGVQTAGEFRKDIYGYAQDATRIVFHDPEKIGGNAQSGRALEILHGPLVELVNEMRPHVERGVNELILKITVLTLMLNKFGLPAPLEIPMGWAPVTFDISFRWPSVFPMSMMDLKDKVQVATMASGGNLISRESLTRWLAKDFDIEDVEEELQKIAIQEPLNPFMGGF